MAIFDFFKKKNGSKAIIDDENNNINNDSSDSDSIGEVEDVTDLNNDPDETTLEESEVLEDSIEAEEEEIQEIEEPVMDDVSTDTPETKVGFFKKIISGLDKTRKNLLSGVENVLKGFTKIDEEMFEELEEVLIMADIGAQTSSTIIESVKNRVKKEKATEVDQVRELLIEEISKILNENNTELVITPPTIILIIGVNGVGKTTTIGKLSNIYQKQGKKVMLAAGDTFRAAAIDQLEIWANRSKVDLIKHQENSDPAAVVFDAVKAAKARKTDILICDTAGRLHNKKNLMEELRKIYKVINREYPEAQLETFLVLDGTTGQNALQQAKSFKEICDITGIVLTKLDGTAKGGIVIAIKNELNVPVRFIGVGEALDDLQEFNATDFANALFYKDNS